MTQPKQNAGKADPRRLAFEGSTGYLLSRVGALARRNWSRMLAERNLTPHHYGTLMTLAEVGPLGQQQLSELIGIDPRNVVPIIDQVVDRGLLAREIDPADRRRRVLTLTDTGRDVVEDLHRSGTTMEQDFLRALSTTEQETLHRTLLRLLDTVTGGHQ